MTTFFELKGTSDGGSLRHLAINSNIWRSDTATHCAQRHHSLPSSVCRWRLLPRWACFMCYLGPVLFGLVIMACPPTHGELAWAILAFRLMTPVTVQRLDLVAFGRAYDARRRLLTLQSTQSASSQGPTNSQGPTSSQGPSDPVSHDDGPPYQLMKLVDLRGLALQRAIPFEGKTANRLRLELAGWAPPSRTRVDLPQADSVQAAMMSFVEAEYVRLERKSMRQENVFKRVRLYAAKIREKVDLHRSHGDDSPSGRTDRWARLLQLTFEDYDYREARDLTGSWSQEDEEEECEEEEEGEEEGEVGPWPAGWGRSRGSVGSEREISLDAQATLEAENGHLVMKSRCQQEVLRMLRREVCKQTNFNTQTVAQRQLYAANQQTSQTPPKVQRLRRMVEDYRATDPTAFSIWDQARATAVRIDGMVRDAPRLRAASPG